MCERLVEGLSIQRVGAIMVAEIRRPTGEDCQNTYIGILGNQGAEEVSMRTSIHHKASFVDIAAGDEFTAPHVSHATHDQRHQLDGIVVSCFTDPM